MPEEGNVKELLSPVLRVLRDLGGKFVFSDDEGNTFVLMSKKELVEAKQKQEQQLPLPPAKAVRAAVRQHAPELSEDVIEAINRDIALSQTGEEEPMQDTFLISPKPLPKLRFEPLRGDLSPDLQD